MTTDDTTMMPLDEAMNVRSFDLVLRGYDRAQVDRHVDWLETELAQAQAELARTQPSYEDLGERIGQILELADAEATSLRTAAQLDAERVRTDALTATERARGEASAIIEAARGEAGQLVEQARAAAERERAEARSQVRQIHEAAQREVDELAAQRERIRARLGELREQLAAVVAVADRPAVVAPPEDPSPPTAAIMAQEDSTPG
ncbi:MAG TPA: hypothetical protein VNG13_16230 [Mycobacteriales bacterium]|nr:hypothetical protein [Mycobacteriales bacterium]